MLSKESVQQLQQCKIYSIQNEKFTEMCATKKWSLVSREQKLHLHDGGQTYAQLSKEIIRIKYKDSQAFFSNSSNSYIVLLISINSQLNDLIQYKLQQFNIVLIEWASATKKNQENIKLVCGKKIDYEFNGNCKGNNKSSSIGYKIGGFFGAINSIVAKPTKKINEEAGTKMKQMKEAKDEQLSEQGKKNWNKMKEKMSQLNEGAASVIKPATSKLSSFTNSIGQKFNKSENGFIKGLRQFGNNLKDSLNDGYKNYRKSSNEVKQQQIQNKELKAPESERQLK